MHPPDASRSFFGMILRSGQNNGPLLESPRFSRRSRGSQALPGVLWATGMVLLAVAGVAAMFGVLAPLATDINSVVPVMVPQERASVTSVRAAAAALGGVERDVSTGRAMRTTAAAARRALQDQDGEQEAVVAGATPIRRRRLHNTEEKKSRTEKRARRTAERVIRERKKRETGDAKRHNRDSSQGSSNSSDASSSSSNSDNSDNQPATNSNDSNSQQQNSPSPPPPPSDQSSNDNSGGDNSSTDDGDSSGSNGSQKMNGSGHAATSDDEDTYYFMHEDNEGEGDSDAANQRSDNSGSASQGAGQSGAGSNAGDGSNAGNGSGNGSGADENDSDANSSAGTGGNTNNNNNDNHSSNSRNGNSNASGSTESSGGDAGNGGDDGSGGDSGSSGDDGSTSDLASFTTRFTPPTTDTPDTETSDTVFTADTAGGNSAACPSDGKWKISQWDVGEPLGKAWLFYEAQKSGKLPASHRVSWRGDSYLNDKHNGVDLTKGWFDAGDHLKLVFPLAWSVTNMAWAMRDGRRLLTHTHFGGSSNWEWGMQTLQYGVDFLLACDFGNGEFVAQIGVVEEDHSRVLRAERDNVTPRTSFATSANKPGADLLLQASAALAAASHVLRETSGSHALANRAESKAKDLFAQALKHPGIYSDSIPQARLTYVSHNWEQYAFWAAAWLHTTTGEAGYKQEAEKYFASEKGEFQAQEYGWQNVYVGACAVMWQATGEQRYEERLRTYTNHLMSASGGVRHTGKGLVYISQWGSLRHAMGAAGIVSLFGRGLKVKGQSSGDAMMEFAERQVTYALGASGHSWVVGYGCNPPQRPHHRNAALTLEQSGNRGVWAGSQANANVITGALVGGPDENDQWQDDRNNFRQNEVALDYNAAFLFALVQVSR